MQENQKQDTSNIFQQPANNSLFDQKPDSNLFGSKTIPQNTNSQQKQQENNEIQIKQAMSTKREQYRVELRKQNIDKKLSLKRLKYTQKDAQQPKYTLEQFQGIVNELNQLLQQQGADQQKILEIMVKIRNVSTQEDIAEQVCSNADLMKFLIVSLDFQENNEQIMMQSQFITESCWIISNLAFYSQFFPFQDSTFIPVLTEKLFKLQSFNNISVISISLHCLANILSENDFTRAECLKHGILELLNSYLVNKKYNQEMLQIAGQLVNGVTTITSNVQQKDYTKQEIQYLLSIIQNLIPFTKDDESLLYNVLKATSNLICDKYDKEIKQLVYTDESIVHLVLSLGDAYNQVLIVISEISKILVALTAQQNKKLNQIMIGNKLFEILNKGISNREEIIRINCAVVIANIVLDGQEVIQELLDDQLINNVLNKLHQDTIIAKRQYLTIVYHILQRGTQDHMNFILNKNILEIFSRCLGQEDPYTVKLIVKCLRLLANYGNEVTQDDGQGNNVNVILVQIEKLGISAQLEKLQEHPDDGVYEAVVDFITQFFITE